MASASVRRWRESVPRETSPESRTGTVLLHALGGLGLLAALVAVTLLTDPFCAQPRVEGAPGGPPSGRASNRRASDTPPTDDQVAKQLGLTIEQVHRLHTERGLSNEGLVQLPAPKLARALARLEEPRPDNPQEAANFRLLRKLDEKGQIQPGAIIDAIETAKKLRQTPPANPDPPAALVPAGVLPPPATVAGLPVGPAPAQPEGEMEQPQALTAGISPGGWTWLGPGNIGGRTRAIVVHPTTPAVMWAGSVGGGVWRTTTAGATWAPLTDFMGSLAVSCLVMQPANSPPPPAGTVLYAGTGEGFYNGDALRGAGIFKSSNGGATWTQLSSTANANFYWVNRLAFSPNGKTLLAATRNGLFRSSNGGTTWTPLPAPVNIEILDVRFHPANNNRCVAAGRDGKAFYSTNGGTGWAQATGLPAVASFGGRVELAYARANPNTVYASVDNNAGEVFVSTDGGKIYALKNTGTHYLGSQGWYDNTIWAGDPTNVNLVVVGGLDLYRSTNGGATFTQISQWWQAPASAHADHHTIVSHPGYNGIRNKAVFFGNDGGIYRANDVTTVAGTSGWVVLNNNYGATQFYGAAGNPTSGRIIGGTQDNGTIRFTPPVGTGVNSWTTMFGGDGGFGAADPTDPNFFYGEYVRLQIHRSTNAGTSASYIFSGIGDAGSNANFIAPFILDPNNPNTLLAGGQQLWRSVNVKASTPFYTSIKPSVNDNISAIAVAKGDSNIIWVGHNSGNVYKTTNGAGASPSWSPTGSGTLPSRFCTRITIDPGNSNRVYATFGGYTTGNIWMTTDGGTTWTNIAGGLPAAPVYTLAVHPSQPNFLYAGTEVGVFASNNGGVAWSPTNEGPANVSVEELFWMNQVLCAVTHGRGAYRIDLGGATP